MATECNRSQHFEKKAIAWIILQKLERSFSLSLWKLCQKWKRNWAWISWKVSASKI